MNAQYHTERAQYHRELASTALRDAAHHCNNVQEQSAKLQEGILRMLMAIYDQNEEAKKEKPQGYTL